LQQTLKQRSLLPQGQRVLVAVSGGQDSRCLLKLLLDLQPQWSWQLAIAHCDHRWAGDVGNADFVRALAQAADLPFYLQAATQMQTREAAARQWRYQALSEIAQRHEFASVVTGHTASDRAETLLYNLIRGSGADGLQALTWERSLAPGVRLVRPLLNVARAETAQFCQAMQLAVWDDPANHNLHYARNQIRQTLLPYLSQQFNPQVEHALAQTAELLQADVEYLETAAREVLAQARHASQPGLNRRLLQTAPRSLQRRAIRQFLQTVLPTAPGFDQIEKLRALITAPNRSQTDPFPGGAIAQVDGDWIWLKSHHHDENSPAPNQAT
jgi:tRNA(Ile)-lysidine synthase